MQLLRHADVDQHNDGHGHSQSHGGNGAATTGVPPTAAAAAAGALGATGPGPRPVPAAPVTSAVFAALDAYDDGITPPPPPPPPPPRRADPIPPPQQHTVDDVETDLIPLPTLGAALLPTAAGGSPTNRRASAAVTGSPGYGDSSGRRRGSNVTEKIAKVPSHSSRPYPGPTWALFSPRIFCRAL